MLDPFMGSGTTAVAAVRAGRHYLGYDTDEAYVKAARERADAEVAIAQADPGPPRPDKAVAAAGEALAAAGFQLADPKVSKRRRFAGGVSVDWIATDAAGAEWLIIVAGASTVMRSGFRRSDVLFRTLGEAAVLTTAGHRVLVLTTDLPSRGSAALAAVAAARGATLVDALELAATGVAPRLAAYAAGGQPDPVGELLPGL